VGTSLVLLPHQNWKPASFNARGCFSDRSGAGIDLEKQSSTCWTSSHSQTLLLLRELSELLEVMEPSESELEVRLSLEGRGVTNEMVRW
jgi:hypothetical protein